MRALSLTQPWATLVALGKKRFETRSWRTKYRGQIAIQAARNFPQQCQDLCDVWPFNKYISSADMLYRGDIIAVATLKDIQPTELIVRTLQPQSPGDEVEEFSFGDFSPGRWAWELIDVRQLKEPVVAWGMQGLWTPDPETRAAVERASA